MGAIGARRPPLSEQCCSTVRSLPPPWLHIPTVARLWLSTPQCPHPHPCLGATSSVSFPVPPPPPPSSVCLGHAVPGAGCKSHSGNPSWWWARVRPALPSRAGLRAPVPGLDAPGPSQSKHPGAGESAPRGPPAARSPRSHAHSHAHSGAHQAHHAGTRGLATRWELRTAQPRARGGTRVVTAVRAAVRHIVTGTPCTACTAPWCVSPVFPCTLCHVCVTHIVLRTLRACGASCTTASLVLGGQSRDACHMLELVLPQPGCPRGPTCVTGAWLLLTSQASQQRLTGSGDARGHCGAPSRPRLPGEPTAGCAVPS